MATIEQLGIRGIRSFGTDALEVISFTTPLTVIVGQNGAGKTTLVEALNYALTGELPPLADRGKGWIFDPRAAETPEVKAQVRVAMNLPQQKRLVVLRNMQLTHSIDRQGRLKATFKALDSVVKVRDSNGQQASITHKCVNADEQIASLLGVSGPALEYVIFCHQEDSCWPLGDMQTLKKRFDCLFGATKYVRALEALRQIRKKHAAELKDSEHNLRLVESHLSTAANMKLKLRRQEEENSKVKRQLTERERIHRLEERAAETAGGLLSRAQEQLQKIRVAEELLTLQRQQLEQLRSQIVLRGEGEEDGEFEFEETLEELEQLLHSLAAETKAKEAERTNAEARLKELRQRQVQLQTELRQQDALVAEKAKAEERVAAAHSQLRRLKEQLAALLQSERLPELADACARKCREEVEEEERAARRTAEEQTRREKTLQAALSELQRQEEAFQIKCATAKSRLEQLQQQRETLMKQLEDMPAEEELRASLEALRNQERHDEAQEGQGASTKARGAELEGVAEDLASQLASLKTRKTQLQRRQRRMQFCEELSMAVNVAQEIRSQKEAQFEEKEIERKELLEAAGRGAVGSLPVAEAEAVLKDDLEKALHAQRELREKAEGAAIEAKTTMALLERHRRKRADAASACRESLRKIEDAQQQQQPRDLSARAVDAAVASDEEAATMALVPLRKALELKERKVEKAVLAAESQLGASSKGGASVLRGLLDEASSKGRCPLCLHEIGDYHDWERFEAEIEQRVKGKPQEQREAKRRLEEANETLRKIKAQQTELQTLARLQEVFSSESQSLENLQKQADEAETRAARAREEGALLRDKVAPLQKAASACAKALAASGELDDATKALRAAQKSLNEALSSPGSATEGELLEGSLSALQKELESLEETQTKLEKRREETQAELHRLNQAQLERQRRSVQRASSISQIQERLQAVLDVASQVAQTGRFLDDLEGQMPEVKKGLAAARMRVKEQTERLQQEQRHAAERRRLSEGRVSELASLARGFEEQRRVVEEAEAALAKGLASARGEKLAVLEKEQREAVEKTEAEERVCAELSLAVDQGRSLYSQVQAGIELKKKQRQEERQREALAAQEAVLAKALREEAASLKQILQQLSSTEAETQNVTPDEKTQTAEFVARLQKLEEGIERSTLRLREQVLPQAEELYTQLRKRLASTGEGLGRLRGEAATRDEQSRQLAAELKSGTFASLDVQVVDAVACCEAERLVVEDLDRYHKALDRALMKYHAAKMQAINASLKTLWQTIYTGRDIDCIARQKVLASIAVRMALAETFGFKCRLLALDEPTTNLDDYNCESLANALSRLVRLRSDSQDFQLILITHDENFVRALGRAGLCDRFVKVSKDDAGRSRLSHALLGP